jgi:hypothetical protein
MHTPVDTLAHPHLLVAGIPMESVIGSKTSVFIGNFTREYEIFYARDPEQHYKYLATCTGAAMFSNRLSWFYDFAGPSLTIDTAYSSSLNALHLRAQSLRSGESNMVSAKHTLPSSGLSILERWWPMVNYLRYFRSMAWREILTDFLHCLVSCWWM